MQLKSKHRTFYISRYFVLSIQWRPVSVIVWKSQQKKKTTKAMSFARSFDDPPVSVEMTSDTHVDSTDLLGSASVERWYEPIGPTTSSSSELLQVYRALRHIMLTVNSDDFPNNGRSDLTLPPMSSTDADLRNCAYENVTFDTQ